MSWLLEAVLECRRMEIGRMEILCWGKGEREVCVGERGSFTLASFIGGEFFCPVCSGSEARLSDYFICVNIFN